MNEQRTGFRELEHTADWELEVWGPDLPCLFEQAARGMYALKGSRLEPHPRIDRTLNLQAPDLESLLVAFLGELLYLEEVEGLGFDSFDLQLKGTSLAARIGGAPLKSRGKDIKAVTYHNLAIRKTERGLEVNIVFDV
jgi:SHS2 domain-containing protein